MENQIKQLFINFIRNNCSLKEQETVLGLIRKGGYEEEWLAAMEETEEQANAPIPLPFDQQALFSRIKTRTAKSKKLKLLPWLSAAAVLTIIGSVAFLLMRQKTSPPVAATEIVRNSVQKTTGRKWIKLPDGTSVQLNTNSHLDYPDSFDGLKTREVNLTGEAFFDVKHDAKHPFIIHTGKIKTTVLGTAFNISAFSANESVTVTVSRGKVMVQDQSKTLAILLPDQQLHWDVKRASIQKKQVNANAVTYWKAQDLIMDDITLEDAAAMIAKRYQVQVGFKSDRVKNCRLTAAFLDRNNLEQVIEVLKNVSGASFELKGKYLTIDGAGCEN